MLFSILLFVHPAFPWEVEVGVGGYGLSLLIDKDCS